MQLKCHIIKKCLFCMAAPLFFLCLHANARELKLNALFSDGMVLQRQCKVPVWGKAPKGSIVKVTFAGQEKKATAKDDGRWEVWLDPLQTSSKPKEMVIASGNNRKVIKNVLVGEVWFCSGQSNMVHPIKDLAKEGLVKEKKYRPLAAYIRKEMASAKDSLLRQIRVPLKVSPRTPITNFVGSWIAADTPEHIGKFSGTDYFFGRELRQKLNIPIGLILCSQGGSRIEPWIPPCVLKQDKKLAAYYKKALVQMEKGMKTWSDANAEMIYKQRVKKWEKSGKKGWTPQKPPPPNARYNYLPTSLFNGMVSAVIPYAIRGVIWYQGESNVRNSPDLYEERFAALIPAWRKCWGQGDFPFYYAQLANLGNGRNAPVEKNEWATICDSQRRCMRINNTGMAVINDIGEKKDIHPHNKMEVGKRLALWALGKTYGIKVPAVSGPIYRSSEFKGNNVIITFDYVGSGLMTGHKELLAQTVETNKPLKYFQITGKDRKWKWAQAKIIGKNKVEVYHPAVTKPVEVRYAWFINPVGANLYNKEGLPASLFTTAE